MVEQNTAGSDLPVDDVYPGEVPPVSEADASSSAIGGLASGTTPSLALARSLPLTPDQLGTMDPYDLFKTQMSTDSAEARVDAMRRLLTVSAAIGPDRTLSDLLPYLASNVAMDEEEEDEILLVLAEKIGAMVPSLVPGHRALPMLPILERLAAVEETVVRDKAVDSINKILSLLLVRPGSGSPTPPVQSEDERRAASALILAMSKRLTGADWFTAKVSAAGIAPHAYGFYNDLAAIRKESNGNTEDEEDGPCRELRTLYKDLADDDAPMVRRSAARHLGKFVESVAGFSPALSVVPSTPTTPSVAGNSASALSPVSSSSSIGAVHSSRAAQLCLRPDIVKAKVNDDIKRIMNEELVPLYKALAADEQDSVRLLAAVASGGVGLALGMDPDLATNVVLPVVRSGCVDLSWRVRHNLAKEFSTVAGAMGFQTDEGNNSLARQTEVFTSFSRLLQDAEAEVRAAAVENIARMTQLGGPDLFQSHMSPLLATLADDPVLEVRSKLAYNLMDCCDDSICNKLTDRIILQDFKPLIEGFLNDEYPEVQLQILTKLSRVSHLLSKMDAVVGSILAMAKAPNWRVREAVGHLLPHLAEARGVSFFEDHLLDPWLKLLLDQVSDVRSSCVKGMPKLLSVAGASWIQREILPHYVRIFDESVSYLTRITIIRSFAALASGSSANGGDAEGEDVANANKSVDPQLHEDVVTQLLRGLDDPVANVRMVAARALASISKNFDDAMVNSRIRPALTACATDDEDIDCKYYAQIALDACT